MARAAKSSTAKSRARKTATSGGVHSDDRLLDAALAEAEEVGWRNLRLDKVAHRADLALGDVLLLTPTKRRLLSRFLDRIDRMTFSSITAPDARDKVRDRLFDIVMRRFDALNRHREGAKAMISGLIYDPAMAVCLGLRFRRSAATMLAAAGVRADGVIGHLRVHGLAVVFLAALKAWMRDDSADMAKTMAVLDRALAQTERLARFLPGASRDAADPAET